jgi:DNA-binding XRE family transcriptional regulator
MKAAKRRKLEQAGWQVDDFLDLSPSEAAYIAMKIDLGDSLKQRRIKNKLSQVELAKLVKSSQSRIAKMETGDPGVSIDLLMKSLLALGASRKDLARAISS